MQFHLRTGVPNMLQASLNHLLVTHKKNSGFKWRGKDEYVVRVGLAGIERERLPNQ